MNKSTDIQPAGAALYFLPIRMRVPLKFGAETLTSVTCARASLTVAGGSGQSATGWGETPLSVQWVWPSAVPYELRHSALQEFCVELTKAWAGCDLRGHPMEIGCDFQEQRLPGLLEKFNRKRGGEPMPWLAALVCCSVFDLALHDAYGRLLQRPVYETYTGQFMNRDLAAYLQPAAGMGKPDLFSGRYPADFLE